MIELRVKKAYAAGRDSAAFSLDAGFTAGAGVTALFGPSGAGKTLTLECLAGFVRPDTGRILLNDRILFDAGSGVDLPARERGFGYVFQNYALFPHMTLHENLTFAAEGVPKRERHKRIAGIVDRFRLTDVAGRRPHELSGGQKQRGSIARALAGSPRALLLDEPSRGLDARLKVELYETLRDIGKEFSVPALLVTHDLHECFELATEMIVLREGKVMQSGTPAAICARPASTEIAQMLGIFNILPVEIRALDPSRNTSVLRYQDFEFAGHYYPGHLKGDRIHLAILPEHVRVSGNGGGVPAELLRVVDTPAGAKLEFRGGLAALLSRDEYEREKHNREWTLRFPAEHLKAL